jgi:hypothetical protein
MMLVLLLPSLPTWLIRPLISSTHRVLLFGISLTLFALLFAAPARATRQFAPTWSFSASMSSYLSFARISSLDVLNCWRVDVFLNLRCCLSFVLRRPTYLVLGCLKYLLFLLLVVFLRGLLLHCFYPLLGYSFSGFRPESEPESWPGSRLSSILSLLLLWHGWPY